MLAGAYSNGEEILYLFSANQVQSSPPRPHLLSQKIYPFLPTTTDGGLSSFADCRLNGLKIEYILYRSCQSFVQWAVKPISWSHPNAGGSMTAFTCPYWKRKPPGGSGLNRRSKINLSLRMKTKKKGLPYFFLNISLNFKKSGRCASNKY